MQCLRRPEEGIRYPGTGINNFELIPLLVLGNQTWVFWKGSQC